MTPRVGSLGAYEIADRFKNTIDIGRGCLPPDFPYQIVGAWTFSFRPWYRPKGSGTRSALSLTVMSRKGFLRRMASASPASAKAESSGRDRRGMLPQKSVSIKSMNTGDDLTCSSVFSPTVIALALLGSAPPGY